MHVPLALHLGEEGDHGAEELPQLGLAEVVVLALAGAHEFGEGGGAELHDDAELELAGALVLPRVVVDELRGGGVTLTMRSSSMHLMVSISLKAMLNSSREANSMHLWA